MTTFPTGAAGVVLDTVLREAADAPVLWDDAVDGTLVCAGVVDVTPEIKTFVLAPPRPRIFRHLPGQYLTVTVDIAGRPVSRCYTISSPPTRPYAVDITVKRERAGEVSGWLHDHLRVGAELQVVGPMGQFTMAAHPAPSYLLLAGGVGITPLMSMLRTLVDLNEPADVVLVSSARSPEHLPFRSELAHLGASHPALRVVSVCEAGVVDGKELLSGRLSRELLLEQVPDLTEREVFLCGPPAYMESATGLLLGLGVSESRIHTESFVLEPAASDSLAGPPNEEVVADTFRVSFARSGRDVQCAPGQSLLSAALGIGLRIPSSCTEGMCGTCKVTKLAGSVEMNHAGGIRPKEIAADKILLCCSYPREDLVIDA